MKNYGYEIEGNQKNKGQVISIYDLATESRHQ
jgi:hypothetical protein